jgi:hypothetical protein
MAKHIFPAIIIGLMLTGCGLRVPEIQENPWNEVGAELLVQKIVQSIHCEFEKLASYIRGKDIEIQRKVFEKTGFVQPLSTDWLLGWGAQMQISLTVDEKSTLSPSGSWSPMKVFFLGLGATASSEATRIETLNYYYLIKDLINAKEASCPSRIEDAAIGSLLIESDLKLTEWLSAVVLGQGTGEISFPQPPPATAQSVPTAKNSFTHEVKFEIFTSGNITPMWKLALSTINPTGIFFSTSRDRTHDLLITFGPNVQATVNGQVTNSLGPNTPAAGSFLASQIGLAISNQRITSGLLP